MPASETAKAAQDAAGQISPGWYTALGIFILETGRVLAAWIRAKLKFQGQTDAGAPTVTDQLNNLAKQLTHQAQAQAAGSTALLEQVNEIRRTMATREDVDKVHARMDEHLKFHLEQKP